MVKTRLELKVKVKEFIEQQTDPFSTRKVVEHCQSISKNINLSPNRMQAYVRGTGAVDYDNSKKLWVKKGMIKCHTKMKIQSDNITQRDII